MYFIFLDNVTLQILNKTVLLVTPFYYHDMDKHLYDIKNWKMCLM